MTARSTGDRKGIVVVHGIGFHPQSETLLGIGRPFLDWVAGWMTFQKRPVRFERTSLAFNQVDRGAIDEPSHVTLKVDDAWGLPGLEWVMAEVWWSSSFEQPSFAGMVAWVWQHFFQVIFDLVRATWQRTRGLKKGDLGFIGRVVNLGNCVLVLSAYVAAGILGYPLLVLLFLAARIPIPALQQFIVVRVLQSFLVINIAQFRIFLDDEIQASNMRRRFEDTIRWLVTTGGCTDVYVIAHSEGAVVAFDALCHPDDPGLSPRVKKLFTLGAGLNKSWLLSPGHPRLRGQLPPHISWVDFWTAYDPVPAGSLRGPNGSVAIFEPDATVEAMVTAPPDQEPIARSPSNGPASLEVTYRMDILSDHGGYWQTGEVLGRVTAEIDAPQFWNSQLWVNQDDLNERRVWRWRRLTVLAGVRLLAAALGLATLAVNFSDLARVGAFPSQILQKVPGVGGLLESVPDWIRGPAIGALTIVLVFYLVYDVGRRLVWERWEARERGDALRLSAAARANHDRREHPDIPNVEEVPITSRRVWWIWLGAWVGTVIAVAILFGDGTLAYTAAVAGAGLVFALGLYYSLATTIPSGAQHAS